MLGTLVAIRVYMTLMIENTAPTKILKHKNVHIYFSLMTLLSEQTLSTESLYVQQKQTRGVTGEIHR